MYFFVKFTPTLKPPCTRRRLPKKCFRPVFCSDFIYLGLAWFSRGLWGAKT